MTCPRCSTTSATGDRFCASCGLDLAADHPTAEPSAPHRVETSSSRWILGALVVLGLVGLGVVVATRGSSDESTPQREQPAIATTTSLGDITPDGQTMPTARPAGSFPDVVAADVVDGLDLVVWLDSAMYLIDLDDLSAERIGPGTEFVSEVSVFETVADRIVVIDDSLTNAILPGDKGSFVLLGRANRIYATDRGRIAWTVEFGSEARAVAHELSGGEPLHQLPLGPGMRIRGAFDDGLLLATASGTYLARPESTSLFSQHEVLHVADPWLAYSRCSAELVCEVVVQNGLTGDEWVARSSSDGDDVAVAGAIEVAPTGDAVVFLQSAGSEVVRRDGSSFLLPDVGTQRPRWSLDGRWVTNRDSQRIVFSAADGSGDYEFRFATHGYGDDMPFNLNEAYALICDVEVIDDCS